nr:hypothetical protein [Sedimentibacter sp.]
MRKMKKMRLFTKIFTFLFLITAIFSTVSYNVYAQDKTSKVTINEYQSLKVANKEYNELKKNGLLKKSRFDNMPEETIYAIENYKEVYTDKIKKLQSRSVEELKNLDYNDSQIKAIQSFNGSEEMLLQASSTCDVTGGFRNYTHSSSGTSIKLIVEFRWEGLASNWFDDIFAVAWSSPMKVTSSTGSVLYKDTYGIDSKTYTHNPAAGGLYASYIKFAKAKNIDNKGYYVSSGSMIIQLSATTNQVDIVGYAEYGYTYISINPSVSFDGLSIGFSTGTSTMDSVRFYSN